MRRRSFLKLTGGAFASALFSGEAAIGESASAETAGGGSVHRQRKAAW